MVFPSQALESQPSTAHGSLPLPMSLPAGLPLAVVPSGSVHGPVHAEVIEPASASCTASDWASPAEYPPSRMQRREAHVAPPVQSLSPAHSGRPLPPRQRRSAAQSDETAHASPTPPPSIVTGS